MTRATRFASYASVLTLCYFLAWSSTLPAPFIAAETKDQIIPVVRETALPADHDKKLICVYFPSGCSFRGGRWCRLGLTRWQRSDGGYGLSEIVLKRIRN